MSVELSAEPTVESAAPPPEAPAEPTHNALDELPDMDADVEAAKAILREAVDDGADDDDELSDDEPKPKVEAKAEVEPKEEPPADHVAQLKQILGNLSEEERTELLGTADSAFAALTSKKRRIAHHEQQLQQERAHFQKVQAGFDELLDKAQKNPVAALETLGWTLDDLVKYTESGEVPLERLQSSLEEKFKKELHQVREELENTRYQTNMERWHADVARGIQAVPQHAKHFPNLAKKLEQGKLDPRHLQQRIIKAQAAYFTQNKQKLELSQALGYIEQELEHQRQLWLDENPDPSQAGAVESAAAPEVQKEPLLTNNLASERRTPKSAGPIYEEMDEEDLKAEARRLLYE